MEDHKIMELYEDRDQSAIGHTKDKYGRLVRMIVNNILHNSSDAEECENDIYYNVWNAIPPVPRNFKAFLLKVARNQALKKYSYIHAQKREAEVLYAYDELAEVLICRQAEAEQDSQLSDCINDFLGALSTEKRKVFMLRYWYFMSVKEIVGQTRLSKSKVETMLFRTRNELKIYLKERGYFNG